MNLVSKFVLSRLYNFWRFRYYHKLKVVFSPLICNKISNHSQKHLIYHLNHTISVENESILIINLTNLFSLQIGAFLGQSVRTPSLKSIILTIGLLSLQKSRTLSGLIARWQIFLRWQKSIAEIICFIISTISSKNMSFFTVFNSDKILFPGNY